MANDFAEILKPRAGDWPTYHGRLDGNRHSALAQITTANVSQPLAEVDSFRARLRQRDDAARPRRHHVHHRDQSGFGARRRDGPGDMAFSRPRSTGLRGDAAIGFNRGVAVLGSRVFLVTDNAHLACGEPVNGALLWEVVLPENTDAALRRHHGAARRRRSRHRRRIGR